MLRSQTTPAIQIVLLTMLLVGSRIACAQDTANTPGVENARPAAVTQLITRHCIDCHGPETQEADLRLDTLRANFNDSQTAAKWIEVMDNLHLGEMPPAEEAQPPVALIEEVTDWISDELGAASNRAKSTGGRVLMRRLNRSEYANIVRDLLAVEFLPGEGPRDLLPPDGTLNGFDKVSKALLLDPSLMEKYFEIASLVADKAVVTGPPPVPTRRNRMQYEEIEGGIGYIKESRTTIVTETGVITMSQGMRSDENLRHPWNGKLIPVRGRYKLRVRVGADPKERETLYMRISRSGDGEIYFGKVPGTLGAPEIVEIERAFDVPGSEEIGIQFEDAPKFGTVNYHYSDLRRAADEAIVVGNAKLAGRLRAQTGAQGFPNQGREDPDSRTTDHMPRILFDWIELEGPLYDQWPPKSTELIFHRGLSGTELDDEYAREIVARLLPVAFRRSVTNAEIDRIAGVVSGELKHGEAFTDAVQSGIIAMLCSPSFLLVNEPLPGDAVAGASSRSSVSPTTGAESSSHDSPPRPLTDHELAFRLSLFLWSSIPDRPLRDAAAAGELQNSDALLQHVRRMLKNEPAAALVDGFARQWFKADEFDRFAVDRNLYRDYYSSQNAGLNEAINAEPIEFFRHVLQTDGSVLSFLDSNWTMANEPLARYYGIDNVQGREFVKVSLPPGSHRGGLTTMAAVHKFGSDGNRTKPIERGKYILDVLFNDPPKPPPPNVGEVEPNIKGENLTVRQRLDQHRSIPACASCHRTLDPYGMALENFNVIGQWRTRQDGERGWWPDDAVIDASGTLPNGVAFTTIEDFRAAIRDQSDRFLRGLSEKLFTYALGRIVEPRDRTTIDGLVARMKSNGHSLHSLIEGIVLSDEFRTK